MSTLTTAQRELVGALAGQYRAEYALPRDFYHDAAPYEIEMAVFWRHNWLFAGHGCQVARPGDFFVYGVDGDEVIIVRQDDGGLAAMHNVCRHRGSLIVEEQCGSACVFVCPYHQWTYSIDGALRVCRNMPALTDKSRLGLLPVAVREVAGLIFICLADAPPPFEQAAAVLGPMARPQGFARAGVAWSAEYEIAANWKLVWENNRECYHCDSNHPQYVKANYDRYDPDSMTPALAAHLEEVTTSAAARWAACGLTATHTDAGLARFPDAARDIWYSADRTVLVDGYETESMDGERVAPLMGDYADADVGTLRLRMLPNFWNHSSCDHAVSTRLTPAGPRLTRAQVTWLVDENAVEGRDYELPRLLPFWQLTSEQDWAICVRQQRGVDSHAYRPGPLSPGKEYNVSSFIQWYLRRLQEATE